jgi:restriction endonuclease S subunit
MMPDTLKQTQLFRFDQMAVQVKDKVEPEEADVDRYVGLEHIDPESLKIRRWGEPSDVESSKILFRSGDIIFGKRRAYQRKLAVADFDGICSAHAMVLRPKTDVVLEELLPFFMQSDIFMGRAVKISVGGLSPTINWGDLAKEEFALPPLEEQRRIKPALIAAESATNKLMELAKRQETVKASLHRALMEKGVGHTKFKSTIIGFLPEEWSVSTLGEIAHFRNGKGHEKNIDEGGDYIVINSKYISTEGSVQKRSNMNFSPLSREDIVMVMSDLPQGSALAKCRLIEEDDKYTLNQRICAITPKDIVRRDFLFYAINRNRHFLSFDNRVSQTNLRRDEVLACPVPVPPLSEQEEIAGILTDVDSSIAQTTMRIGSSSSLASLVLWESLK